MTQTEWPDLERQLGSALSAMANEMISERLRPETMPESVPGSDRGEIIRLPLDGRPRNRRPIAIGLVAAAVIAAVLATFSLTLRRDNGSGSPALNRSQVDWSQVGPDWTLILQSDVALRNDETAPEHLMLVDPQAEHYNLVDLGNSSWVLSDWNRQSEYALLTSPFKVQQPTTVLQIDLRTGTRTRLTLPGQPDWVHYARTGDNSILAADVYGMTSFSFAGKEMVRFPASSYYEQGVVTSTDGHTFITGSDHGLVELSASTGQATGRLAPPAGQPACDNPQWEPNGDLIAVCGKTHYPAHGVHYDRYSFSDNGHLGAGHSDAQHPSGYLRFDNFVHGTLATKQPDSDYPSLTTARFFAIDASGQPRAVTMPSSLRNVGWTIAGTFDDSFVLLHQATNGRGDDVVHWNPLTGVVTEVYRPGSTTASVLTAFGGDGTGE